MSKFKVGDKVKIVNPISDIDDNYKGSVVTISKTLGLGGYEVLENNRPWRDSELELFKFDLTPELEYEWENQETLYPYITDNADRYNKYIRGIWEKQDIEPVYFKDIKEEKEMNKVLNLWFERKQEKIIKKYAEMEQDFINNHYSVVKSYNELVEQFEKDLDDLYKFDKVNEQFVLEEISDKNTIKYDIDFDKLSCEFTDKHIKEKQGELKELAKIREEVEAQLSLSNELKYQQEVLIQYNIIDKKTKKIVE